MIQAIGRTKNDENGQTKTAKRWRVYGSIQQRFANIHCRTRLEVQHIVWYGTGYQGQLFKNQRMQCYRWVLIIFQRMIDLCVNGADHCECVCLFHIFMAFSCCWFRWLRRRLERIGQEQFLFHSSSSNARCWRLHRRNDRLFVQRKGRWYQ